MRNTTTLAIAGVMALFLSSGIQAEVWNESNFYRFNASSANDEYEPTENYDILNIGGFTVMVSGKAMYERPEITQQALWVLRSQIVLANDVIGYRFALLGDVPTTEFSDLHQIVIWVDDSRSGHENRGCEVACFYGPARLLERDNVNPDKAYSVGFTDLELLIGSMWCCNETLLHELAHAWHHYVIPDGFENQDIIDAYDRAKDGSKWRNVMNWVGEIQDENYAMTNHEEFFAVISATIFHHNYEYPFVYGELRHTDEASYGAVVRGWFLPERIAGSLPAQLATRLDARLDEWDPDRQRVKVLSQIHR